MKCSAVYELDIDGESELFAESESGSLDFVACLPAAGVQEAVDSLVPGSRPESIILPDNDFGGEIYHRLVQPGAPAALCGGSVLKPRSVLKRHSVPGSSVFEADNIAFIKRYADYARMMRDRDYASLGFLLERSHKLAGYRHFLASLAGPAAFYPFALYYLSLFCASKEAELASLLKGAAPEGGSLGAVYDYARRQIESDSPEKFSEEMERKLGAFICDERKPIVLPVVGLGYHQCQNNLVPFISCLIEEVRKRQVLDGISLSEGQQRIQDFIEGLKVEVCPEPENCYDRNALAVIISCSDGCVYKAGYLKREFSALAARLNLSLEARIFSLGDEEIKVQVWGE